MTSPTDLSATPPAAGLTTAEAEARLAAHGPNELIRQAATPTWRMLLRQVANPMTALLVAAATIAGVVGDAADAVAIVTIVLINAVVGFVQEHRAERAVHALRAMTAPRATVERDGAPVVLPAANVVPGDLLVLTAGDRVAADARLLAADALRAREAALTGESAPSEKSTRPVPPDASLADQTDRVFAGTAIVAGSGKAVVTATAMDTELGRIATLLSTTKDETTPMQRQLALVTTSLVRLCLGVVAVVAVAGLAWGRPPLEVLLGAVSLAVAAVPEGLPAVITVALAVGVQRLAAHRVLVRRLPAVETLGAATVICTDKTGTLTTGVMVLRETWGPDAPRVLDAAVACCDADLDAGVGDPTELAILAAAAEAGIRRADVEAARPRTAVHPFDAERKRMSIRRADGALYVKGAVDLLLPRCTSAPPGAADAATDLARRGLRVLGVAIGAGDTEDDLELVGLVGLVDPPRPAARAAIAQARAAGITTVMITGDHHDTAVAVAREIGLLLPDEDPAERVHARATPEDKLRLVQEWKARGAIVAMTGDGVNDAPALREAHIGIAMGITGTEVTREAADLVLADDDFASIIEGVAEGRTIYENIRKTLVYLLTGNVAELMIMLTAAVAGLPAPLLPIQLLWINLITDGLPALALVIDPPESDVLRRPPRESDERMLGRPQWLAVGVTAALEAAVVLGVYGVHLEASGADVARTLAFATLVFSELARAFGARSVDQVLWQVGAFTNPRLLGLVGASAALQLALHYVPAAQSLFGLVPLPPAQLALAAGLGLIPVTLTELAKLARWFIRGRAPRTPTGPASA